MTLGSFHVFTKIMTLTRVLRVKVNMFWKTWIFIFSFETINSSSEDRYGEPLILSGYRIWKYEASVFPRTYVYIYTYVHICISICGFWDLSKKTRAAKSWILAVLRPSDLSRRPDWWRKWWVDFLTFCQKTIPPPHLTNKLWGVGGGMV